MTIIKIEDGRELTVRLNSFSMAEFRQANAEKDDLDKRRDCFDALIARSVGLALEEYVVMGFEDYHRISDAFWEKVKNPLADPNSVSASS